MRTSFRRGLGFAQRAVRPMIPFVILLAAWQATVKTMHLSTFLYPAPLNVLSTFGDLLRKGVLPSYIELSLGTWALAVVAFTLLVLPLAFLLAFLPTLNDGLTPIVRFLSSIPELAWLPLVVLWLGYSLTTVVLVVGYTVFFPVLYNVMLGLRQIPQVVIDATRTLGANRLHLLLDVLLPGSLPGLVTGLRTGASYAFRALLVAELFSGHNAGVGYMIFSGIQTGVTDRIIAGMIVVGILWLAIEKLVFTPAELATIGRWGMTRQAE